MTVTTKTYNVNKTKQLIDLNGHLTNFKAVFNVKSDNDAEFDVAIVDQNILDSEDENAIKYKHATGIINGEIFNDNDIYQNYFLIIGSKKPCKCEVTVEVNQIPAKKNSNNTREHELSEIIEENVDYNEPLLAEKYQSYTSKKKSKNRIWWILFFVVLAILIGIALFYYLKKYKYIYVKQDSNKVLTNTETVIQPPIQLPEKQLTIENLISTEPEPIITPPQLETTEKNITLSALDLPSPEINTSPAKLEPAITQSISKPKTLLDRLNNLKQPNK